MYCREMKHWVPLFQIFLNSPTPEGDASLYFQQHQNPNTSSFLSLLLSPIHSPTSLPNKDVPIFIATLPYFVQSRILSFLTIESSRFCCHRLRSLAVRILNSNVPSSSGHPAFWVHQAACNLLNALSSCEPPSFCPSEKDEFYSLPDWLQGSTTTAAPILPWLPMPVNELLKTHSTTFPAEPESEAMLVEQEEVDSCSPAVDVYVDPEASKKATALKAEILALVSTSEAIRIAHDIKQLCLDSGQNSELALLGLIEPWEGDDETLSVLLSNLSSGGKFASSSWPAYVLCSISLPKLLTLRAPASRVLLSSTISFCKIHPVATVEALLLPLALRKEGINTVLCDVLTRVIKECLHASHVSAFCQKLLCGEGKDRRLTCLPCHRHLISDELVWTEAMFTLFQNILNHDTYLTPDSADHLASVITDVADQFLTSLKFGNLFLMFVTKCSRAVKFHKDMLEKAAQKTNTFVTKSILLKLDAW